MGKSGHFFNRLKAGLKLESNDPKTRIKGFFTLMKEAYTSWNAHDPFRESAVIAYYAIFSLPALLVVITTAAGLLWGVDETIEKVTEQIGDTMGTETADQIKTMIDRANESKESTIATIIGIFTIIFGATGVFAQLQKTLNIIWGVRQGEKKKFLRLILTRIFSLGLVLSIAFLLLISFVLSSGLATVGDQIGGWISEDIGEVLLMIINLVLAMILFTVLFMLMFKILPDVHVGWRDVFAGSVLTAILFSIGKIALAYYFGKSEPGETYGAAGSIILILLWVSYSGMIFFFGAEFVKQRYLSRKGKVIPARGAERVPDDCVV